MKLVHKTLLGSVILLALVLRLYRLQSPLADWHSWRQADTASVAVEYVKHGIDLLQPKYLDLSSIPSGKDNPDGYRMVEFPLIPAIVAFTYPAAQSLNWPVHVWFRLVNIIISLGSLVYLYRIVKLFGKPRLALITAGIFAILPFNLFFSRTTLPEVSLVFISLAALYYGLKLAFLSTNSVKYVSLFILTSALALLIKPTAACYLAVAWYVLYRHRGRQIFTPFWLVSFVASVLPFLLWRLWISRFPEGIPAYTWLLNADGIRFKGAWFRWLFAERIGRLMLGYWGLIPLTLGFISLESLVIKTHKPQKQFLGEIKSFMSILLRRFSHKDQEKPHFHRFMYVWTISMLIYLIVFATGNVTHDYYQVILIPVLSVLVARGVQWFLRRASLPSMIVLVVSFLFMLAFSWYDIRGYYQINNPAIVNAGRLVDQIVPPNALVVAPYGGDTAFLYQTNRRGWPIGGEIPGKISQGASYYVTTGFDQEAQTLAQTYRVLIKTPEFTLIRLN